MNTVYKVYYIEEIRNISAAEIEACMQARNTNSTFDQKCIRN